MSFFNTNFTQVGLSEAWFPMDLYLKTICVGSVFSSRTQEVFDDPLSFSNIKSTFKLPGYRAKQRQIGKGINQPNWGSQMHYSAITTGS